MTLRGLTTATRLRKVAAIGDSTLRGLTTATRLRKVAVIGAGTLGQQVSFQAAVSGFDVALLDTNAESLDNAKRAHERFARLYVERGGSVRAWRVPVESSPSPEAALRRLRYTTDVAEACGDSDLLSENVPEVPAVKAKVYADLHAAAPSHCIFTTNSSTLLPSDFAEATGRPERFLALHFANPIFDGNIGEVMGHAGTDEAVFEQVMQFARDIHMVPIRILKEQNGYICNSLVVPWLNSALWLVTSGVASPEDVDRTWMITMGAPKGPMQVLDTIGLETVRNVFAHWGEVMRDEAVGKQMLANAAFLDAKLEAGCTGIKTGDPLSDTAKGMYDYPGPSFMKDDFLS